MEYMPLPAQVEIIQRVSRDHKKGAQMVISRRERTSLQQMPHACGEKKVRVGEWGWGGGNGHVCAHSELVFKNSPAEKLWNDFKFSSGQPKCLPLTLPVCETTHPIESPISPPEHIPFGKLLFLQMLNDSDCQRNFLFPADMQPPKEVTTCQTDDPMLAPR